MLSPSPPRQGESLRTSLSYWKRRVALLSARRLFCRRRSMDRDDVAFPDADEIAPHARAFARMMFAHAAFEREVRLLADAINPKEPGFGERRENQWTASESGTGKIVMLIIKHRGSGLPQTKQIRNLLDEAVHLCRERNFLAHGTWWCFNRRTLTVEVRGGVRWEQPELP